MYTDILIHEEEKKRGIRNIGGKRKKEKGRKLSERGWKGITREEWKGNDRKWRRFMNNGENIVSDSDREEKNRKKVNMEGKRNKLIDKGKKKKHGKNGRRKKMEEGKGTIK